MKSKCANVFLGWARKPPPRACEEGVLMGVIPLEFFYPRPGYWLTTRKN
jgi:hypothetical protein